LHELSLAYGLVQAVKEEALKHPGVVGVRSVSIRIGKASFAGREQLEFCFGILAGDEPLLKDAKLEFSEEDVELTCRSCGRVGPMEMNEDPSMHFVLPNFACPACGGTAEMTKGRSVYITNALLVTEDDP
jgi:hydrogenase nickel insertion protein HypA